MGCVSKWGPFHPSLRPFHPSDRDHFTRAEGDHFTLENAVLHRLVCGSRQSPAGGPFHPPCRRGPENADRRVGKGDHFTRLANAIRSADGNGW